MMSVRRRLCTLSIACAIGCSPASNGEPGNDAADPVAVRTWTWDFEDGAIGAAVPTEAGAIPDASGNGAAATAAAGLHFVAGQLAPRVAVAFDGASAGLSADIPPIADVPAGESFWLEVVFRTDVHGQGDDGGRGTLVAHGEPGATGWWLEIVDGRPRFSLSAGAAAAVTVDELVSDGRWHRLVAQRRVAGGELALSLDGRRTARATDPTAGGAIVNGAAVHVGASPRDDARLLGEIDRVSFTRGADVPVPADVAERAVSVVFTTNAEQQPGGTRTYDSFRIPSIVRAPDGSLLAFAEARVNDQCDYGDIEIVAKHSSDGGMTWSPLRRIVDAGRNKVGNPVPIVDYQRGRVVLLVTPEQMDPALCDNPTSSCACEPIADSRRMQAVVSDDSGATWSAPRDVTPPDVLADWSSFLMGPGHGIQLEHGARAGSLVVAGPHRRTAGGAGGYVLASHDGGETFVVAASETTSRLPVNESSAVELADGRLYINARHHMGNDQITAQERVLGFRDEAVLTRELAYAPSPAYTRTNAFRGPIVEGSTLRWRGDGRPGNETRVLFSYPAGEHGSSAGQRHDLRIYASDDEAASWRRGKRVVGEWAAYSDLVDIGDGRIGILHEAGAYFDASANLGRFYQRVDFVAVPIESLDDDTVMSWSFEQGFGGALAATGAVSLVAGRHHSTAARFDGASRACTSVTAARGMFDFGARDSFAIEVVFRTSAHAAGGIDAAGTIASRSAVGSEPAWWLRIEDGRLRFHVAGCDVPTSLCGVTPGRCEALSPCTGASVRSELAVSDGAWHRARVVRDATTGRLVMDVDGRVSTTELPTSIGFIKNEQPVCLGAFADGARAFTGELDAVRISLVD